jgi:uncharacterized Tic20 family protein
MSDVPRDPQEVPPLPYDMVDKETRNWAMLAHLSSLLGYVGVPLATVLGPLIVWLMKKDQHPFIDEHGKESLNFQLSMLIYLIVSGLSAFICIGFVLFPVVYIAGIVFVIIAAIKSSNGESYRYPLTIRFVS